MCSIESLREFINDRLSAAAVEIFTVVQQTIVQYQKEVDAQRTRQDNSWRGETKTHTTELRPHHVWQEVANSNLDQGEPEFKDSEGDKEKMEVKQEDDSFTLTVNEKRDHRHNFKPSSIKEFVNGRLTAAAEEIFTVFEQTIIQYQEENDSQRRILDVVLKPDIKLHRIDDSQQHLWKEEQICNLDPNTTLDNKESEPSLIKEEPRELCINQKGEYLELKQEAEAFKIAPTDDQSDQSEPEPDGEQLFSQDSPVDESQVQERNLPVNVQLTRNAELNLNRTQRSANGDTSPMSENQCDINQSQKCLTCGICGKTFKFTSWMKQHYRIHTCKKPYICETCGKGFSGKYHFLVHLRTHTGEKAYCCETCGKHFNRQGTLLVHTRTHTGGKPYPCETCGKCSSRQDILLAHKRTHTGEKPYPCEICGKGFGQHSNFLLHIRTHTGEKPYSCGVCGKNFSRPSYLLAHKRTHTGEKPIACHICGNSFSQRSNLLLHKKSHTGEKSHSCETCGKSFSMKCRLLEHMKTHSSKKLYPCETCSKSFSGKRHLLTHMRTHTGEKPYSCETCGKGFCRQETMLAHKRNHTDEKPHFCETCNKSFCWKHHLLVHLRTHTGEKPYPCETCGKSFSRRDTLLAHKRTHTG